MTIKLPKDAEGREIPLDTSEMFIPDGTMAHAVRFEYIYHTCGARGTRSVYIGHTSGEHMVLYTCDVYPTEPDSWEKPGDDLNRCIGEIDICAYHSAKRAGGGKADMGIRCPNCGGQTGRIDKGNVFVCEKGKPLMREARYYCRHCDSTAILLKKCEPKGVGNDR